MFDTFLKRAALMTGGAALLAGSFYAGSAWAADPKLDDAIANIDKAIALLQAAENPGHKVPFGGHRNLAIGHLEKAKKEVERAKTWADAHPPPDGG